MYFSKNKDTSDRELTRNQELYQALSKHSLLKSHHFPMTLVLLCPFLDEKVKV